METVLLITIASEVTTLI